MNHLTIRFCFAATSLFVLTPIQQTQEGFGAEAAGRRPRSLYEATATFENGEDTSPTDSLAQRRATTFHGFVLENSGAPAEGALVVSSAGGKAITNVNGGYRLEAPLPLDARSVQIIASSRAVKNLVASTTVHLPGRDVRSPGSELVRVDPLQFLQGGTCQASWLPTFGGQPGTDWSVTALAEFDDGGGPALHAGGSFWTAGGVVANGIAKWDGSVWSSLGSGMNGGVSALAVYDDGSGSALYTGGSFTTAGGVATSNIAKWDGSAWTALGSGMNGNVSALAVHDDGSGPALYAGGAFTTAGGLVADRIAKWDGSNWAPLVSGMNGVVRALAAFDDGSGPALYAGGDFTVASGVAANHVAKWDGSSWGALTSGLRSLGRGTAFAPLHATPGIAVVNALTVFDDGRGPALHVAGRFHRAGNVTARNIARWDGSNWEAVGGGLRAPYYGVCALTAYDDGQGPALYAAGDIRGAGGLTVNNIAKWDGSSWSALGTGTEFDLISPQAYLAPVFAMTTHNAGSGAVLCAGGQFSRAGGLGASMIAQWDGSAWTALGTGVNSSIGRWASYYDYFAVATLAVHDDGGGPALYAGGNFTTAGGVAANHVAR